MKKLLLALTGIFTFFAMPNTSAAQQQPAFSVCEGDTPREISIPALSFVRANYPIMPAKGWDLNATMTHPEPKGTTVKWEYEFTVARDCTMQLWVEYAMGTGTKHSRRIVKVERHLIPDPRVGKSGVGTTPGPVVGIPGAEIGKFGDHTGGFGTFKETYVSNIGLLNGYINVLVFRMDGIAPVPHVRKIILRPALK